MNEDEIRIIQWPFTCPKANKFLNLFKGNNKDIRATSRRHSGAFIINTEQISHVALMVLLFNLTR